MLNRDKILTMFRDAGAMRHGHFELSSGRHSDTYMQCALVLQYPRFAEKLGRGLANLFSSEEIDAVVSPAIGGLIAGQEVARAMPPANAELVAGGVPAMFVERDPSGKMTLRRGFTIQPGQRILMIEDVWTTGGSTIEAIRVIHDAGGRVVAAGAIVDRSGGTIEFPVKWKALLELSIESYKPEECPFCRQGSVAVKLGSRFMRGASS